MPTIKVNKDHWDGDYKWPHQGDEWSYPWGNPESQWFSVLLPRIHRFLPAGAILEIAPGYGRWTHFLKDACDRLEIVDLGEACIAACKERFADEDHIGYHVNDGTSLEAISDDSIDLAFSFDSLVHAEIDVLDAYLRQLATKLTADGVGFFHHSALGIQVPLLQHVESIPAELRPHIVQERWLMANHMRARSVTPALVAELCSAYGLQAISQEVVNWREDVLTDCFTTFTRAGSRWSRDNLVSENLAFMDDAASIRSVAPLYTLDPRVEY